MSYEIIKSEFYNGKINEGPIKIVKYAILKNNNRYFAQLKLINSSNYRITKVALRYKDENGEQIFTKSNLDIYPNESFFEKTLIEIPSEEFELTKFEEISAKKVSVPNHTNSYDDYDYEEDNYNSNNNYDNDYDDKYNKKVHNRKYKKEKVYQFNLNKQLIRNLITIFLSCLLVISFIVPFILGPKHKVSIGGMIYLEHQSNPFWCFLYDEVFMVFEHDSALSIYNITYCALCIILTPVFLSILLSLIFHLSGNDLDKIKDKSEKKRRTIIASIVWACSIIIAFVIKSLTPHNEGMAGVLSTILIVLEMSLSIYFARKVKKSSEYKNSIKKDLTPTLMWMITFFCVSLYCFLICFIVGENTKLPATIISVISLVCGLGFLLFYILKKNKFTKQKRFINRKKLGLCFSVALCFMLGISSFSTYFSQGESYATIDGVIYDVYGCDVVELEYVHNEKVTIYTSFFHGYNEVSIHYIEEGVFSEQIGVTLIIKSGIVDDDRMHITLGDSSFSGFAGEIVIGSGVIVDFDKDWSYNLERITLFFEEELGDQEIPYGIGDYYMPGEWGYTNDGYPTTNEEYYRGGRD